MKKQKIQIGFQGKKIGIIVRNLSNFEKGIGLMFSSRKRARAFLFDFKNNEKITFHSFFVFFPFLILWLDKQNKVLEIQKIKPFKLNISSRRPYSRVLEIPFNKKYEEIIEMLVGKKI